MAATPTGSADVDAESVSASIVGASGFAGGELLRILAGHPEFELGEVTSREYAGKSVGSVHPPLRGTDLRFSEPGDLESVDVLFTATPHGVTMEHIEEYQATADLVVDLSADFRLDTEAQYEEWYDGHSCPEKLDVAEYALPEINRENLAGADVIASGGCNATATILGLYPLAEAGVLDGADVVVDVKVGSSEAAPAAAKLRATRSARASSARTPPRGTATRPRSSRYWVSRFRSRATPWTWSAVRARPVTCSPRTE